MAKRFKYKGKPRRHFILQWRRHRAISQETLADRLNTSAATISRIENGLAPYSQDFLDAFADELRCEPADLVSRDPTAPQDPLREAIDALPKTEVPRALDLLKVLARTP